MAQVSYVQLYVIVYGLHFSLCTCPDDTTRTRSKVAWTHYKRCQFDSQQRVGKVRATSKISVSMSRRTLQERDGNIVSHADGTTAQCAVGHTTDALPQRVLTT